MLRFLARAIGGALLLPLLPLFFLGWVWTSYWPPIQRRLTGTVRHRIPPARWAHHARKRLRVWRAIRRAR